MNLNKTFGRVATTLVAGAMLTALAMPAYATDGTDGVWGGTGNATISEDNSIELSKKLTKPANVATPNVEFTVSVAPAQNVGSETVDNIPVLAGPTGSVTIDSADDSFKFEYSDADVSKTSVDPVNGTDNDNTVTVTFNMVGTFTAPGIYKYDVSESGVTDEAYTSDSAYMYVYVEENGVVDGTMTYKVANVVLTHTNTTTGKIANLTNDYGTKTGKEVHYVDLTKKVEGNQGSKNKEFEMEIKIDPTNAGDNFRVVPMVKSEGTWVEATTGIEVLDSTNSYTTKVNLSDGERYRIYGLSANDEYTITETSYSNEGYTAYANKSYEDTDTYNKVGDTDITASCEIKDKTAENTTVAFHNVRLSNTPTGIVMNVAPYVLLVVVAAAGCFVFLRKRRED